MNTTVNLGPLIEVLLPVVVTIATALGAWLVQRVQKRLNIQLNRDQEAVIEKALKGALGFAEEWAYQQSKDRASVTVRNEMAAQAMRYVMASVPDALKHFGLDNKDAVARMIYSRLPTPDGVPTDPVPAQPVQPVQPASPAAPLSPVTVAPQ